MVIGFPIQLISTLRCTSDSAELELGQDCQLSEDGTSITHGALHCTTCRRSFPIDDGILNMIEDDVLDEESRHEQQLRNEVAVGSTSATGMARYDTDQDSMEMIPTLEAVSAARDEAILELGCGDGRYTVLLAEQCQWILAVDFSQQSLRTLRQRLKNVANVALVLGDVTTIKTRDASFDCVFSTLVSNLPTREHRSALYRLAARSLRPDGRFVFSTHHHGLRQRLFGIAKSGRYRHGGIYRYNFTVSECKAEARRYFEVVKAGPIQIYFPFARSLRLPLLALSRFLEPLPLVNRLGELVLCTAKRSRLVEADVANA